MEADYNDQSDTREIPVEDLSPQAFELLCKDLANKWAAQNLKDGKYDIFYRKYEPIDIVVTETTDAVKLLGEILGSTIKKNREHFIECKFYKANLGLEVLGKAYLMTLRYKPRSLTIATTSNLTDRAREFADWLSKELDDFACSLWNPVEVRAFANNTLTDESKFLEKYVKPLHVENWRLFEDGIFKKSLLASLDDSNGNKKIPFNSYSTYFFEAAITNSIDRNRTIKAFLLLKDIKQVEALTELDVKFGIDRALMLSGKIQKIYDRADFISATLIIKSNTGEDALSLRGFPIIINTTGFTLPDFRAGLASELYNAFIINQKKPLLLINGEGGIGKTYLSESICSLAKDDGFSVAHCPLILESEPAFIVELLWLLLPSEIHSTLQKEDSSSFTIEFLEIFFSHFGASCNVAECTVLKNILVNNSWQDKDEELVVSAIARVICSSPQRTVIVLSNCHRISGSCAHALKTLFSALETNNWASGKIKVIIEHRNGQEDSTYQWGHLHQWIEEILSNRIHKCPLKDLSPNEIISALSGKIISGDFESAMDLILKKSGGNPLYINSLLQSLIEHNILAQNSIGNRTTYLLTSLKELRDFVVELTPNIGSVLVRRINYWHEQLPTLEDNISGYLLSVSALVGLDISLQLLAELFNTDIAIVENFLLRLQGTGLVERVHEDSFRFSHEYISAASLLWLEGRSDKYKYLQGAVSHCELTSFVNAFASGRLNIYLGKNATAIKSFNFALQFSDQIFGRMYRCHKEILGALEMTNLNETETILFHTNLQKIVSIGDYLASTKEVIGYNIKGITALQHQRISNLPTRPLFRQYYHNIAHSSLKRNNLVEYYKYSQASLKYCVTGVEYSQFLNRLIKCSALIGDFASGHKAGVLALSIQSKEINMEDPDLESVLWGAIYLLYTSSSRDDAKQIIKRLLECPASPRQLCHNYSLAVTQLIIEKDKASASQMLQTMESLVEKIALKSLQVQISNLTGLIHLLNDNFSDANEKFKFASINAAWSDLTQSELQFGNNHMITSAILGDRENSRSAYLRIMLLVKQLNEQRKNINLVALLKQAEEGIKLQSKIISLEIAPQLRNKKKQSGSLQDVIINNSIILNQADPLTYHHPLEFGFSKEEIRISLGREPANILSTNANEKLSGLMIVC